MFFDIISAANSAREKYGLTGIKKQARCKGFGNKLHII
jgi:hypothetical protein